MVRKREEEWTNVKGTTTGLAQEEGYIWNPTKTLRYNGRDVVFAQAFPTGNGLPYVVVPGYKASKYYAHGSCVKVELIPKKDQQAIKAKVMQRGKGAVSFW